MMRIVVVTVCLNAAATIRSTIESVLGAGDLVSRYLIMDGGSSDGTVEIIREYEPQFAGRMSWLSSPDEGLYDAMNRALAWLHEREHDDAFVLFLGADDLLVAEGLQRIAREVGENPGGAELVFGDVMTVDAHGARAVRKGCEPAKVGPIPKSMPACHQAALFTLGSHRELGDFDTHLRIAADYDFYLRFWETGRRQLYVPVVIAEFSLAGLSATQTGRTAAEYRRVWEKHGVNPLAAWMRMMTARLHVFARSLMR